MAPPTHLEHSHSYSDVAPIPAAINKGQFGGPECPKPAGSLLRVPPWDCTRKKEHRTATLD